jgi:hypothetical protein
MASARGGTFIPKPYSIETLIKALTAFREQKN